MPARLTVLAALAFAIFSMPAAAEIEFIRPGDVPSEGRAELDVGLLELDELYRGLDLLGRLSSRATKGTVISALMIDYAKDDIDGVPGITDADRELAASVEIARKRSSASRSWAENDLDGDGVVTRSELMVVGRTRVEGGVRGQGQDALIELTDEQRETLVLDYVGTFLGQDRDSNDAVTYEEAIAPVDEEGILTRLRTEGGALKPVWDADGNGVITEVEVRRSADRLLDLMDADDNNFVEVEEAQAAFRAFTTARARSEDPSRGKRIKCTLPEVPKSAEIVVLQGESGSAVTNIALDVPDDPVIRMAEVEVPAGKTDVYLIASMRSPTIFRIMGAGAARVKAVVGVAALVALEGGKADLANTPCHRGFLGIRIVEPGGIAAEFGQALGRDDLRVVVAERLGHINLGTLSNAEDTLLGGNALPVMKGDGQIVVDRFLSFDPGGFQVLDPGEIQSTVKVSTRDLPPLEIGLIVLASEGKIDFVSPPPGFLTRDVPDGIKRVVPDGDAKAGITLQGEASRGSSAQFPLTVVVRSAIDLPAGLTTERGVRLIVPDGVPKPRGLPY
jgi:hypothetical protein